MTIRGCPDIFSAASCLDDYFRLWPKDRNVHVWDTADPKSRTKLELAHQGGVAGLACLSTAAPSSPRLYLRTKYNSFENIAPYN